MIFVVKIDRLGSKVEVRGLAVGDDRIYRFEKNVRDVVRSAGLPLRITLKEDGSEDRSDLVNKLRGVFVSDQAIRGESPHCGFVSLANEKTEICANADQTRSTT